MILQIIIFIILLLPVPMVVGGVTAGLVEKGMPGSVKLSFRWISGQIILWAGFQVTCVPMILAHRDFRNVVTLFSGYTMAMVLLAVATDIRRHAKGIPESFVHNDSRQKDTVALVLWGCVIVLVLTQLVLACVLAYEEGDDAFYVSISSITESSNRMYESSPYTGRYTEMDIRHALAPMPIWAAYIARISGMHAVIASQVTLPVALIVMSYAIYYLLGQRLFSGGTRKTALFMLVIQFLVLFGGYSTYSPENFLLVRTAQGKSVMANIIIPFLLYLFFVILDKLQAEQKTGAGIWAMVALTMVAGCLCSTQGTLLNCMFLGAFGLCILVCYRRWKLLPIMLGCSIFPVGMAFLYFRLG